MASSLRLNRLNNTVYRKPKNSIPWVSLVLVALAIMSGLYGWSQRQYNPGGHSVRAVVAHDLPFDITQATVDAALKNAQADRLTRDVVLYITDAPLNSSETKDGAQAAGANVTVALHPDTGRVGVSQAVLSDEWTNEEPRTGELDVSPKEYGVSTKLPQINATRLQDVLLINQTIGHGAQGFNGIIENIGNQQYENQYRFNKWLFFSPLLLALAGIFYLVWRRRTNRYQDIYYRYARSRRYFNTMVLNHELLEAAAHLGSPEERHDFVQFDQLLQETTALHRNLDELMQKPASALKKATRTQLDDFAARVQHLVFLYNKVLASSSFQQAREQRDILVRQLPEEPVGETEKTFPWKQVLTLLGYLLVSPIALVGVLVLSFIMADGIVSQMDRPNLEYSSVASKVEYAGSSEMLAAYDRALKQDYEYSNSDNPRSLLAGKLKSAPLGDLPPNTTIVVAPYYFEDFFTIKDDYTYNNSDNPIFAAVSANDYYLAMQKVRHGLGDQYIDPATGDIREGYIISIPLIFKSGEHDPMVLTNMPWYYAGERDENPIPDAWAHDGNYWVFFEQRVDSSLTDISAPFDGFVSSVLKDQVGFSAGFFYFLQLTVVLAALWLLIVRGVKSLMWRARAKNTFSRPLRSTRPVLEKLLLQLDDVRLNSLAKATGFAQQPQNLTAYEAALADAWFRQEVYEAAPAYQRTLPSLHSEVQGFAHDVEELDRSSSGIGQ